MQSLHSLKPRPEVLPTGQELHAVLPSPSEKVLAPQDVQDEAPESENLPSPQALQLRPSELPYFPAWQSSQLLMMSFPSWWDFEPAAQVSQVNCSKALLNFPLVHNSHESRPVRSLYFPTGHEEHGV